MSDQILQGIFGVFFGFFAAYLLGALFSNRFRSKIHWGKGAGGPPISRFSIVVLLPFTIYIAMKHCTIALGYQWTWNLPPLLFAAWFVLFIISSLRDDRNAKRR